MSRELYHTSDWKTLRKLAIAENIKDNNGTLTCSFCGKPILKEYDCIVHHKEEINNSNETNPDVTLNLENLACVHYHCHNIIHNKSYTPKGSKIVTIVHGAPCSGKTTMVELSAGERDIIVDLDKLWQAISPSHNSRILPVILSVRDTLYDKIQTRSGDWLKAWVITTEKHRGTLERLSARLDADLFHMDTDEATCLRRAKGDKLKIELIKKYFENF